ncbi:response regulator [Mucilaginibacter sp. CSA2-8R]|uniref:response regulator n=1 Tax=Mucilaginibacter sp. CSA2-8R TaxID=3141542 RepID=UPI00315D5FF6
MNLAFIIIDDSELDCFIAKKIIQQNDKSIMVATYTDAIAALRQINDNTDMHSDLLTIILLDLRLPIMSGFEFVEEFERLPLSIRNRYVIYVLSSSMNRNDKSRVDSNENIVKMMDKPLTKAAFETIVTEVVAGKR